MKVNGYEIKPRADLGGADLSGVDLHDANLHYANLRGADLYCAKLRKADLRGADLRDADLLGADLSGADLHYANLRCTNLYGANLRDANLRCAKLHDELISDGTHHHITNVGSEGGTLEIYGTQCGSYFIRRGCFRGTKVEFLAKVEEAHGDNEHGVMYRQLIELFCK